jgi:hypothetical protein
VQGGFFSDDANGYPFGGARASYRFAPTKILRIVPTIGIAHVEIRKMDIDETGAKAAPVSFTGGIELALEMGHFVVGCDLQVMPTRTTITTVYPFGTPPHEKTLWLMPASLFAGATF